MKRTLLVLALSLIAKLVSAQYTFSLPGDGNWYRVATAGGMHAHFEYQYAHNTGNTPSVCSGEIDFINAQNFTIQQHQTMGYAYWDQPQFALLNFGNTSEIWVKATAGVDAGTFTVTHSLQTTFDSAPVADADLTDNGGTLTVYDKLPDNSHIFYGNTIVKNGNVGIGTSNPTSALDVGGLIQISSVNQNTPPAGLSYGLFPYGGVGLGIFSGATDPSQGMGFWTNPYGVKTEVMRISAGGNVSIGTTTPTGLLTLNSTPGAQLSLQTNGTTIANLSVNSNSSLWNGGYGVGLNMAATGADISLQTGSPAATSFIVKNSGNVGIGTTGPQSKLHITGGALMIGNNIVPNNTDGTISAGNIAISYDPNQTNWGGGTGSTMILSAGGYSTIAFHHSGVRVDFIRSGNGTIQLGYDGGWGQASIGLPNGIWNSVGNVGIGITSPSAKLHISNSGSSSNPTSQYSGDMIIQGNPGNRTSTTGASLEFVIPANTDGNNPWGQGRIITVAGNLGSGNATGKMILGTRRWFDKGTGSGAAWNYGDDVVIDGTGNVGIGTTTVPSGYKMAVAGNAIAESMTVKLQANWPDYVFKPSYNLIPLSEVKTYIDKNQHLPEIPSASQIEKDGINLGEMNKILVKKVEELTLYLIEKDKQVDSLTRKLQDQEERLQKLEKNK